MADFIVAVAGATASGKTALGIEIARRFNGEIISCDSMQIYRGLDIGTAKPTAAERKMAVHHMIDIADSTEKYSVERFCVEADLIINDILLRKKLPVLVGGTGLYMDNLIYRTQFSAPVRDDAFCAELEHMAQEKGNDALFEILKQKDPAQAQKLHQNDIKRVIRAIETVHTTGKTRAELDLESRTRVNPYDCLYMAIDMEREKLYSRIDERVDAMLLNGLIEETKNKVLPVRDSMPTAMQAIGYKEVLDYLDSGCNLAEMTETLKRNTRRYAKRQLTWLRRNKNINWLSCENTVTQAEKLIKERIDSHESTG